MTTLTPAPPDTTGMAADGLDEAPRSTGGAWTGGRRSGAGPGAWWTASAELALLGVTVAAVWGLGRLFLGDAHVAPLVLIAAASHGLAWAGRRLGLRPAPAAALSGLGLLVALAWVIEPHTTTYGLPLEATWRAVADDFRDAWMRFGEVRAPTQPIRGFVLGAAVATWLTAFIADTFAFRFRARFEALLPSFVLFVFGALLGVDGRRLMASGFYAAAVLVFAITSGARQRSAGSWLGGRARDGNAALVRQGLLLAVVAVAAAALIGPRLPGAGSAALWSWRDAAKRKPPARVTVSPLVDIRAHLVNPSPAEAFTVRANLASYWRLTSLDRFDGTIWSSLASYQPAGDRLPRDVAAPDTEETVGQVFEIGQLSSIWLPAAYRPERIEGPEGIRYDPESASLLTDDDNSDGLRYTVESAQPRLSAEELRLARPAVPRGVAARNLELPEGFPQRVRTQADEIVSGTSGPYEAAKALQDWFREQFTYDLDVPAGHDDGAIERFLFVTKRGYCEQFAGAYAAMARSVGLPARVAVGFTPGQQDAAGVFHVNGANAHAWPEVYISGTGWIAFEPTPGRAVPGGQDYTGVEPETPPASPPAASPPLPGQAPATTTPPSGGAGTETPSGDIDAAEGSDGSGPWVLVALVVVLLAGAVYVVGLPQLARRARARRRSLAVSPEDRVLLAWLETEESLARAGFPRRSSETAREYARRAPPTGPPGELERLAHDSSAAAFAPRGAADATAARAESAAAAICGDLYARASWWRRALWALDPRPQVFLPLKRHLKRAV